MSRNLPGVANANNMVNIAENEFQQFVGQDTRGISKAEERVVGKYGTQPHSPRVEYSLLAQSAQ